MAKRTKEDNLPKKDKAWRSVKPSKDVQDSLQDLRDLCFKPPEDPSEPHTAMFGGSTSTAAQTLVALEALYDENKMNSRGTRHNFSDGTDVVKEALSGIYTMMENPDRHLYKPHFDNDPPPREANISLSAVLENLDAAVLRDFPKEVDIIKAEITAKAQTRR